ncbi:expressed unknown protein (Partial), partial [Seminavis robusta]|eukprot:Sro570_g168420.1 n/a (66) ;mRNA; r:51-414
MLHSSGQIYQDPSPVRFSIWQISKACRICPSCSNRKHAQVGEALSWPSAVWWVQFNPSGNRETYQP